MVLAYPVAVATYVSSSEGRAVPRYSTVLGTYAQYSCGVL